VPATANAARGQKGGRQAMRNIEAFLALILLCTPVSLARVDAGRIEGRVTLEDGRPLPGVRVTVSPSASSADTDADGRYTLRRVAPGTYTLTFDWRSERVTRSDVAVQAGSTTTVDEVVAWNVGLIEEVRVTAVSRRPERIVEAPASVTAVSNKELVSQAAHGQVPKVFEFTPGVDITQISMVEFLVSTRGFNSSLNRRVAVQVDGRDLTDPFVGAMEWPTVSYPLDDFANAELVRGPAAALYGANATGGIFNLTTRQPRDSLGGIVRLTAGGEDSLNADVRWAGRLAESWYMKVSGGLRRTDGFSVSRLVDTEYSTPCSAPGELECLPLDGIPFPEDDIDIAFGTLRFDKVFDNGSLFTFEGGTTEYGGSVFINANGRGQVNDVERPWGWVNLSARHWNVLVNYSEREALATNLNNANPFLLDADNLKVEGQTNWDFAGERVRLVAGASYIEEDVESNVMGGPSSIDEQALFAQVDWKIGERVKLVGALRWDDSSLFDAQVSPKASVVVAVNPLHSLRFTYNEAFQLPTYADFFLQFPLFPTDTTSLNDICAAQGIDCGLAGSTTNYLFGNESLALEEVTTLELGYKGILGNKAFLTIDLWDSENDNFVTGSLQVTPGGPANPNIDPWVGPSAAETTPIDTVDCPSAGFAGGSVADCVREAARDLLAPMDSGGQLSNLGDASIIALLSSTNFGDVDTRGADVGLDYFFNRAWKLSASYSWFDFDVKDDLGGDPNLLLPNTPEHKASVGIGYEDDRWQASLRGRWVDDFFWTNGGYGGTVESFTTVDLNGSYAIGEGWRVGLHVANLFDDEHWEAFGADLVGRRGLAHVAYSW
jgi:iron complex outermembrane receptor protein